MDWKAGWAEVFTSGSQDLDPGLLPGAVRDAGFEPGAIEVTAVGRLVEEEKHLFLALPSARCRLVGGARLDELKQAVSRGDRMRVTGPFVIADGSSPASLAVEDWEPASSTEE